MNEAFCFFTNISRFLAVEIEYREMYDILKFIKSILKQKGKINKNYCKKVQNIKNTLKKSYLVVFALKAHT